MYRISLKRVLQSLSLPFIFVFVSSLGLWTLAAHVGNGSPDAYGYEFTDSQAGGPTVFSDRAALAAQNGYVLDRSNNRIKIVDTASHTDTGQFIDVSSHGSGLSRAALSPDGQQLYAGLEGSGQVLMIDTATNTIQWNMFTGSAPHGIAFSADGAYVFVANQDSDNVTVIDTGLMSTTNFLPVGDWPMNVASSPYLDKVYVTNRDDGTVSVIDVGTLSVVNTIGGLASPSDIVLSPDGQRAYVMNQGSVGSAVFGGIIGVIDTINDSLIDSWPINGSQFTGLDISPDGGTLYVADEGANATFAVDTSSGSVVATIPTNSPWDVEVFPEQAGPFAYVSDSASGVVSVIDINTNSVSTTISLDGELRGLALFAPTRRISIAKTVNSAVAAPGTPLTYTISFNAPTTATNVLITDVIPLYLDSYSYSSSGASITPTGGVNYSWQVEDLAPDEGGLITIAGVLSSALPPGVSFVNTAIVSSSLGTSQASVTVATPLPNLRITKSAMPTFVQPGDAVTYTLSFVNAGGLTASGVLITDSMPSGVIVASVTNSGAVITQTGPGYAWAVQDLAPSQGGVITISGVLSDSLTGGILVNTASITSSVADDAPADNASAVSIHCIERVGYVLDQGADRIRIVDTVSHADTGQFIDASPYGGAPLHGALSPDGQWLYAGLEGGGLLMIDTATNTPLGNFYIGNGPHDIAFSADGAYAFVTSWDSNDVTVIDTGLMSTTAFLPVGAGPLGIASSPYLDKVYVANRDDGTVSVIDVGTLSVVNTIGGLVSPKDIVLSPDGQRAYVMNQGSDGTLVFGGIIGVIDTINDSLIDSWPINGSQFTGLDISPDGGTLYVTDVGTNATFAVDTTSGSVVATIPTNSPWDVEVFPAWAGPLAYVSGGGNGVVSVIDINTNSVTTTMSLGGDLRGLALFAPRRGINIAKTANPAMVAPGAALTYTISFNASTTATNVLITDVIPLYLDNYSYSSSGASITPTGGVNYAWQVEDLAPDEGGVITITGVVSLALPPGVSFVNTAIVNSSLGTSLASATVLYPIDLEIVKIAGPLTAAPGSTVKDTLVYTISVQNNGSTSFIYVGPVDILPSGTTFLDAAPGHSYSPHTVSWNPAPVAIGSYQSHVYTAAIRADVHGFIINTVWITETGALALTVGDTVTTFVPGPPTDVSLECPTAAGINNPVWVQAQVDPLEAAVPMTYTWQTGAQAPIVMLRDSTYGSAWFDDFGWDWNTSWAALSWSAPGPQTVTFTAVNARGSVTATCNIALNSAPTVALSGPASGQVNTSYTFTATVSPINTPIPIYYDWFVTDQPDVWHSGGLNDTITVNWPASGAKVIQVWASNDVGWSQDAIIVDIAAPLLPPLSTIWSVDNGAWNDPATWNLNRTPVISDEVLIQSMHIVTALTPISVASLVNQGTLQGSGSADLNIAATGLVSNTGFIRASMGYASRRVPGAHPACNAVPVGTTGSSIMMSSAMILNNGLVRADDGATGSPGGNVTWQPLPNLNILNGPLGVICAGNGGAGSTGGGGGNGGNVQLTGSPVTNSGIIWAGDGGAGDLYGGAGGGAYVFGENTTNAGSIGAGRGGDTTDNVSGASGGNGGNTEVWGKFFTWSGFLVNVGNIYGGDGGDGSAFASNPQDGGCGGNITLMAAPNVFLTGGTIAAGVAGTPSAGGWACSNGSVWIDPAGISISGDTRISGGDVVIYGGDEWTLDLKNLGSETISATGNLTLAVGSGGVIDLQGNAEQVLQAAGQVHMYADDIQLDTGVPLFALAGTDVSTSTGHILRNVSLAAPDSLTAQAGGVVPFSFQLLNSSPISDTFALSQTNLAGWSVNGLPALIEVGGLDNYELTVSISVPPNAPGGSLNEISVYATSQGDTGVGAQAVVVVSVESGTPIYLPLVLKQ